VFASFRDRHVIPRDIGQDRQVVAEEPAERNGKLPEIMRHGMGCLTRDVLDRDRDHGNAGYPPLLRASGPRNPVKAMQLNAFNVVVPDEPLRELHTRSGRVKIMTEGSWKEDTQWPTPLANWPSPISAR
jgi:hypothetical protein